jgi:hypothetical protein
MITLWGYIGNMVRASYYRFEANYSYLLTSLLLGISIGLIIGVEQFNIERRKDGIWKINYPKMILVGLPSLYFSIASILFYGNNRFITTVFAYPMTWLLRFGVDHVDVFQIILGYIVITSFYKNNRIIKFKIDDVAA